MQAAGYIFRLMTVCLYPVLYFISVIFTETKVFRSRTTQSTQVVFWLDLYECYLQSLVIHFS